MKRAVPWVLTGLMAFAIVVLLLNLREKDYYDGGSLAPPEGVGPSLDNLLASLMPPTYVHPCPACGECTHPIEIVENRRTLTLRDHDGWYKLFWAGDETYHFDDLVFLAACLQNSTARDPGGSWTVRGRLGPPTHSKGEPHACGEIPTTIASLYLLTVSESPVEESLVSHGTLKRAGGVRAFSRTYDRRHLPPVLHFGWRLPPLSMSPPWGPPAPCPCGGP